MCDENTISNFTRDGGETSLSNWREQVNRRQFGALGAAGAAATLAACSRVDSAGMVAQPPLTESNVKITTADGTMDAFFVHPSTGTHPAVICWPDIAGLRDAFKMMARRTAAQGYAVLVANPYYRDVPAPQFADFGAFMTNGGFQQVGPWRARLTATAIMQDAATLADWFDAQSAVDKDRGIGTEGYCMGGPFTVWSAAGVPGRIRGAASFHGGGLVTEDPMSPDKLLVKSRASHLFAVARNDDAKAPEVKGELRVAAEAAGRPAEIEVYDGDHGWTVIDSPAYAKEAAEKAYARKTALYQKL